MNDSKTTNNDEEFSFPLWLKTILGLIGIGLLLSFILILYKYNASLTDGFIPDFPDRAEWGVFGDFLGGALNPIFGFASFIALLVTIVYQSKELRASTKELKNSAKALANQNKAIELQSFEQTFFSWLNSYRALLETIILEKTKNNVPYTICGRLALISLWKDHFYFFTWANDSHSVNAREVQDKWENLYKENEYQIDSLFRTLYKLISWIDTQHIQKLSEAEKWMYISIVRSQLSWVEMSFLYCNGLTFRGRKFKEIAEKYALFDNLEFNDPYLESLYSQLKFPEGYAEEAYSSNHAKVKLGLST